MRSVARTVLGFDRMQLPAHRNSRIAHLLPRARPASRNKIRRRMESSRRGIWRYVDVAHTADGQTWVRGKPSGDKRPGPQSWDVRSNRETGVLRTRRGSKLQCWVQEHLRCCCCHQRATADSGLQWSVSGAVLGERLIAIVPRAWEVS